MTSSNMTEERVLELIEMYGAETGAWPETERESAVALMAANPDRFAEALDTARQLDALLLREALPEPSTGLADAILAQAPKAAVERKSWLGGLAGMIFPQGARWPAGAALASLLMGLVGGYAYAAGDSGYDEADSAYYAAFGFDESDAWVVLE